MNMNRHFYFTRLLCKSNEHNSRYTCGQIEIVLYYIFDKNHLTQYILSIIWLGTKLMQHCEMLIWQSQKLGYMWCNLLLG